MKYIYIKKIDKKKGFTIIETLVAVTILTVAVTGPLVVASKGFFGANVAKNQMLASYLAQESMEIVKNIRDNNIFSGANWLSNPTANISGCIVTSQCDVSVVDATAPNFSIIPCNGLNNLCPIFVQTNGYGHTNSGAGTESIFHRGFYIHGPGVTTGCVANAEECGVTVVVSWDEGPTPYSVILTSVITNNIR